MSSERFPLLGAQRDVWFGHLLDNSKCAYNMGLYTEIAGELDLPTLKKAAAHVVNLTDALRLRFHAADNDLWQDVLKSHHYVLPVVDVTCAADPRAAGIALIDQDLRTPFHLAEEAPFRWLVIKIGDSRWLWGQIYHHIALDGQSAWIVSNRVAETYSALREGATPPKYPVGGIAVLTGEEASYRTSSRFLKDRQYWKASLDSSEKMMSWSYRSGHASVAGSPVREICHLSAPLTEKVRNLAQSAGLRSEHLVIAAVAIIQSAYQGQQDVVLGAQLLGRLASSARAFPAMVSNEGHLRLTVDPELKCEALTKEISRQMRLALRHQSYRYEDLRHDIALLPGEPDHFSLCVNIMPVDSDLQFHGVTSASHYLAYGPVRDLSLTLFDNKRLERLRLDLDGNTSLYQPPDLKKHLSQIVSVIDQIATATVPVGAITLVDDTGEQKMGPLKAGAQSKTLPDVLAARAKVSPTKIAAICGEKSFTYDELEKRSNRLSRYLVHRGLGPESIVAMGLERSFEMLVATLAVLKAGAACLPLDPHYPVDRLGYMLVDSGADVLLTQQRGADMFAAHRIPTIVLGEFEVENALATFDPGPLMQRDRIAPLHPQNVAFLLYTSGSTGQPKGVGLTHQNLTNKLLDQLCLWNVGRSSQFAFSSSINFDPSIHQMLLPLAAGGTCVILSSAEVRDSDQFMQAIAKAAVTHLDVVPAFASVIADHARTGELCLEVFILGGEVLPAQLLQKLRSRLPNCRFFNMYGPTETSVDATAFEVAAEFPDSPVPIGRALRNYSVYILDPCLRPLPEGVAGEIYIAGAGVARGYWRRARLTAERFLPCPFGSPGERMYRTGDRGYRNATGDIIFCGRYDDQIKLRGARIELAEIETALLGQDGVERAAVVVEYNGADSRLTAYVSTASGAELRGRDLRKMLATSLPDFMIPSTIAVLETMPLLPNGKLDRKSLSNVQPDVVSNYVEPDTDLEGRICSVFRSLTGVKQVSALDNFFALGGHSLLVMRLVSRLRSEHGHGVPLELVFTHPTPRALAAAISARGQLALPYDPLVRLRDSGPGAPLFCVHPAAGLARVYDRMVDSIDTHIPIYGLQARGIDDGAPPHASIPEMAEAYVEAVRGLQHHGPYHLAGWSFGGVVAHEMAAQLEARGEEVGDLFLIDSYFSNVDFDVVDPASAIRSMTGTAYTGQGGDQEGAGEHLLKRIHTLFVQSSRLIAEHTPHKIRSPIVFFRAKDNAESDLSSSLGMVTGGAVEIEETDACHYSLFDLEHAGKIGAAINRYMTRNDHRRGVAG